MICEVNNYSCHQYHCYNHLKPIEIVGNKSRRECKLQPIRNVDHTVLYTCNVALDDTMVVLINMNSQHFWFVQAKVEHTKHAQVWFVSMTTSYRSSTIKSISNTDRKIVYTGNDQITLIVISDTTTCVCACVCSKNGSIIEDSTLVCFSKMSKSIC